MTQKVKFHPCEGKVRNAKAPFAGAAYVVVDGVCPHCKAEPFNVAGVKGTLVRGHDTYTADAGCVGCNVPTGKLVITVNTLFGIEEDERVLNGRCRVY